MLLEAIFVTAALAGSNKVEVPRAFRACQQDSDCIKLAQSECSQCCSEEAINKGFEEKYKELVAKQCKTYDGPVCDCSGTSSTPVCHTGRCSLKRGR